MKALLGSIILVTLVALSAWLNWPREPLPEGPPPIDAAQIRDTTDNLLIPTVVDDLRWRLAVLPVGDRGAWRSWAEPARHVFALSFTISEPETGTPGVFSGFADIIAAPGRHVPDLAVIADAYSAIGAPSCAAIVTEAASTAERLELKRGEPVPTPAAFAALDAKLRRQSAATKTVGLLKAYIRSHAEDIAAARPPK